MKGMLILVLVLIIIAGCAKQPKAPEDLVVQSEVSEETVEVIEESPEFTSEPAEVEETPKVEKKEFQLAAGESATFNNKVIKVNSIEQGPKVDIEVDGTPARLTETKSEEIVEELSITVIEFNYRLKDSPQNYVVLKIDNLKLKLNEFLLFEDESIKLGDKEIELIEARSDGSVYVDVKPGVGMQRIPSGSSEILEGIEISPSKTFTKDSTRVNYAIIEARIVE